MGNARGGLVSAAHQLGMTAVDYTHHIVSGEKWCSGCKAFHPEDDFPSDASRGDGRATVCGTFRRQRARALYVPRGRRRRGWLVPARDGDKLQARRRVNYLVESRQLAHPNTLPCVDCAHLGDDRRHEYDHFKGYSAEHQLDVEPVCSTCHHKREAAR